MAYSIEFTKTNCKDCGRDTVPGPGSARCKECWNDKVGVHTNYSDSYINFNHEYRLTLLKALGVYRRREMREWLYYSTSIDRLVLVYTCKPLQIRTPQFILVGVL